MLVLWAVVIYNLSMKNVTRKTRAALRAIGTPVTGGHVLKKKGGRVRVMIWENGDITRADVRLDLAVLMTVGQAYHELGL